MLRGGAGPVGLMGLMVLDDCIWTEQERLPTPCCPIPPPPPLAVPSPHPHPVLPVRLLRHWWGQRSLCVAGTLACKWLPPSWCGEEAASCLPPPGQHTSCRLCGLESRPGPQRVLQPTPSPGPPSLTVAPPLSSGSPAAFRSHRLARPFPLQTTTNLCSLRSLPRYLGLPTVPLRFGF